MSNEIRFWRFLQGVATGEFIMLGFYGIFPEMLLMGCLVVFFQWLIDYMKRKYGESKGMDS